MKLILISLLLLLVSCTQYRYDITYEKCNGQTGSIISTYSPFTNRDFWDDVVKNPLYYSDWMLDNICSFSYTRNEIK